MAVGRSDLLQAPGALRLGKGGLDLLLRRHAAHDMFDEMSSPMVIWDEEVPSEIHMNNDLLQQLVREMDDQEQCKQGIFKAPVLSNGVVHEVFDAMCLRKETSVQQKQVVFMDPATLQSPIHEVFHEIPIGTVVWDDDLQHNLNSHTSLLHELDCHSDLVQQEDPFDECLHVDNKATVDLLSNTADKLFIDLPHEVVWDEEMSSNIIMHSGLLQQLAFGSKSTTTTQPNQSDINTKEGVLEQLAFGEEYLDVGTMIPVDHHTISIANGSSLFLEHSMVNTDQMSSEIPKEVVWDEECLYGLDSRGNYLQQLAWGKENFGFETGQPVTEPVLEDLLVVVYSSTVSIHSDLQPRNQVCKSELFATNYLMAKKHKQESIDDYTVLTEMPCQEHTQQLVAQIMSGVAAVSEGPAHVLFEEMATTYLERAVFRTPGLFVWDKMPAAIGTHHGLLQYSAPRGNYFGDDKKVESVDHVTSRGASHVMFHAMSCTNVVWNDDLLNGHEYQDQVVSTIAAMSRICVDLDKQKTYRLNKCKKLQVYLDNSEVFAKMHFRVVWDSKMLSNMDKFGLLQQLALGVLTHVSTPPHLCKQSQNVAYFVGNSRIPDAEQDVDSMTLHANDSSQYLEFEMVLRSAGDVVGLLSKEYTNRLYKGHLYHICYGACSRHEMKFDCNHLVILVEEQVICGAQYVIDERPPWRRSAFSPENDDMTATHSMFHQIHAWTPNDVSPWGLARFSIVGLQKFQHHDHSNHQTTVVSKYDLERMLCSGCLNMPWDPGGNLDCFVLAIAWGQAMFCGGGNVMTGTIEYMGWNIIGFGPCGGLTNYVSVVSSSHKGKKEKTKKDRQTILRNRYGLGRCSSSSLLRSSSDFLCD